MFRSHDLYRGLKFIVAFLSCDVYKSKQCNSSQGAPKRRAHNKGSFTFSHGVQNMFRQTSQGCYFRLYFFLGQIQASLNCLALPEPSRRARWLRKNTGKLLTNDQDVCTPKCYLKFQFRGRKANSNHNNFFIYLYNKNRWNAKPLRMHSLHSGRQ